MRTAMQLAILRRLRRLFGAGTPRDYSDVVPSYELYADLQKNRYQSFESEHPHWQEGQRRFIAKQFSELPRESEILDVACGDGVGLRCFREMGFSRVTGVEFNHAKAERALGHGYSVHGADMHDLSCFTDRSFDIVYSSNTIEHAYHPRRVLKELTRVLRSDGELIVVLPYPDTGTENDPAHGAKYELGTNVADGGIKVASFFARHPLRLTSKEFDDFREPEILLRFTRMG
jgi:ubiquinone/menaquinone biosynthesis C-methylase UbiE